MLIAGRSSTNANAFSKLPSPHSHTHLLLRDYFAPSLPSQELPPFFRPCRPTYAVELRSSVSLSVRVSLSLSLFLVSPRRLFPLGLSACAFPRLGLPPPRMSVVGRLCPCLPSFGAFPSRPSLCLFLFLVFSMSILSRPSLRRLPLVSFPSLLSPRVLSHVPFPSRPSICLFPLMSFPSHASPYVLPFATFPSCSSPCVLPLTSLPIRPSPCTLPLTSFAMCPSPRPADF